MYKKLTGYIMEIDDEQKCTDVISSMCVKNKKSNREKILEYEKIAKTLPQVNIPVIHYIHGGMYGREITIPKGTILTGQIYKFDHFDIMLSGDITVSTDTDGIKRFTGTNIFKGLSGKKRAGFAHEDTRWITFHPFDGVDGEEIQNFITADNFDELEQFYIDLNRNDYLNFVDSIAMSQEEITEQVENKEDQTGFPDGCDHLYVSESKLSGKGMFSKKKLNDGQIICCARTNGKRTPAGRYTNHAVNPNACILINDSGDADLIALKAIEAGEEITINYRQVLSNRIEHEDLLCQE